MQLCLELVCSPGASLLLRQKYTRGKKRSTHYPHVSRRTTPCDPSKPPQSSFKPMHHPCCPFLTPPTSRHFSLVFTCRPREGSDARRYLRVAVRIDPSGP